VATVKGGHRGTYYTQMLLDTLLARATSLPGFDFWRGLAPRRFLVDSLLADVIRATETLPISKADGTFSVVSTSPLGLPETLPANWSELGRIGDHFAAFRVPVGTTTREVTEALALELIPLFFPSDIYEAKLFAWLEKEIGPDEEGAEILGDPSPDTPGPIPAFDIPCPLDYLSPRSEEQQDLDYLYGNGRIPPQHHGYRQNLSAMLDPSFGPPECHDTDVQQAENERLHYC
jgi:hypothetical protein